MPQSAVCDSWHYKWTSNEVFLRVCWALSAHSLVILLPLATLGMRRFERALFGRALHDLHPGAWVRVQLLARLLQCTPATAHACVHATPTEIHILSSHGRRHFYTGVALLDAQLIVQHSTLYMIVLLTFGTEILVPLPWWCRLSRVLFHALGAGFFGLWGCRVPTLFSAPSALASTLGPTAAAVWFALPLHTLLLGICALCTWLCDSCEPARLNAGPHGVTATTLVVQYCLSSMGAEVPH